MSCLRVLNISGTIVQNVENDGIQQLRVEGEYLKDCFMQTDIKTYVLQDMSNCDITILDPIVAWGIQSDLFLTEIEIGVNTIIHETKKFNQKCNKNAYDILGYSGDICSTDIPEIVHFANTTLLDRTVPATGATKGDPHVFFDVDSLVLTQTFSGDITTITGATYCVSIHQRVGNGFSETPIFLEDSVPTPSGGPSTGFSAITSAVTSSFTGVTVGSGFDVDFSGLTGEFIVKLNLKIPDCTAINSLLSGTTNMDDLTPKTYGVYSPETDGYFLVLDCAQEADILTNRPTINDGSFFYELLPVNFDGQTGYTLTNVPLDDIIILNVNGLTLTLNDEYFVDGTNVVVTVPLLTTDIVTTFYIIGAESQFFINENFEITSITSGTTAGPTDKIFFNTTTGKYEIYLDNDIVSTNDVILAFNGLTLENNVEFYKSISIDNRLILEIVAEVGDIVDIFYVPANTTTIFINTNPQTIQWSVPLPFTNDLGNFDLRISTSGDTAFTSPIQTFTGIPHTIGVSVYSQDISLTGSVGTEYIMVVDNTEVYETFAGDEIDCVTRSEIITLVINSNAVNGY